MDGEIWCSDGNLQRLEMSVGVVVIMIVESEEGIENEKDDVDAEEGV